jgi:hypothetical protein
MAILSKAALWFCQEQRYGDNSDDNPEHTYLSRR